MILYASYYKYLGIIFDQNMKFEICLRNLGDAGSRALGGIIGKCKELNDLSFNTYTKLYNTCVKPVLEYSSAVWGGKGFDVMTINPGGIDTELWSGEEVLEKVVTDTFIQPTVLSGLICTLLRLPYKTYIQSAIILPEHDI